MKNLAKIVEASEPFRIGRPYNDHVQRWAVIEYYTGFTGAWENYTMVLAKDIPKLEKLWAGTYGDSKKITKAKVVCFLAATDLKKAREALGLWMEIHGSSVIGEKLLDVGR